MSLPSPGTSIDTDDLIALLFLQTRQDEFWLVSPPLKAHLPGARQLPPRIFAVGSRKEFPGLVLGKRVFGSLRLLDVKPPCSNLAGTSCSGHSSFRTMTLAIGRRFASPSRTHLSEDGP